MGESFSLHIMSSHIAYHLLKVGVTEVPRTILMHKKKKPTAGQTEFDDLVKVESASMEGYENMEENIDINVDHGQQAIMTYEKSPLKFAAPEHKKQKHRRIVDLNLPCDVCSKRFPNRGRLRLHQIIHTDKKPYQCDQCDRAFNQPANMSTHKKKMHFNHMDSSVTKDFQEETEVGMTDEDKENIEENDEPDKLEGMTSKSEEEHEVVDQDKVASSEESGVQSSKLTVIKS